VSWSSSRGCYPLEHTILVLQHFPGRGAGADVAGEAADVVVERLGGEEGELEGLGGGVERGADVGHALAGAEHVAGAAAERAHSAGGLDLPVVVADEVADFAFGENAEQGGEGALGGVPRPAGFDEGNVDAAIDVLGAEAGVLAAVLAAERLDEAAVLPVQAIHAAALVVVQGRG
jgi:hypothetical protein